MPAEYDNDLLREGILRFKANEFEAARNFIERALENSDDLQTQAQANFYLSKLTDDPVQKRRFLEETLAIDMSHAEARRALAILDGKLKPEEIVNPETMPAPATGTVAVQADRFTCPKCGGRMVYTPEGASLICENCQRTQHVLSGATGEEQDFFVAMANGKGFRKTVSMKSFQCKGCGANFLLASLEISATCAYCGSVHVIALDELRELVEPDAIIPMAFDQTQAALYLAQWMEKNRIEPEDKVTLPRGLYLPVWTFEITGNIPWSGRVIRNKQEVPVSGEKTVSLGNICIPASRNLSGLLEKTLAYFDLTSAPVYDSRYLAGWPAEIYELSMSDASLEARRIAVEQVRKIIHTEFGHVINLGYSSSAINVCSFKLVLVPVWVTEIIAHDQAGRVLINGLTGSVCNEVPVRGLAGWIGNILGS
jgi:Zn finger protein HypA/HybF involved in hydrogenase expression